MAYTVWQSPKGILIQAGTALFEMSVEDALQLSNDIRDRVTPAPISKEKRRRTKWTPELSAEIVRLYVIEEFGFHRIAKTLGIGSHVTIQEWLKRAGVALRPVSKDVQKLLDGARAAKKRAA